MPARVKRASSKKDLAKIEMEEKLKKAYMKLKDDPVFAKIIEAQQMTVAGLDNLDKEIQN